MLSLSVWLPGPIYLPRGLCLWSNVPSSGISVQVVCILLEYILVLSLCCVLSVILGFVQNMTIEERVTILEIQVADTQEDLMELEGDVNFLFDEQVIEDERLLNLEQTTIGILGDLDSEYVIK